MADGEAASPGWCSNTRSGADTDQAADGRRALAARLRAEGNGFPVAEPPPLLGPRASLEVRAVVRDTIADQPAASIAAAAEGMAERPIRPPISARSTCRSS